MEDVITLYPSNWLYNAGVIGFLKLVSVSKDGKKDEKEKTSKDEKTVEVEKWLNDDGTVKIDLNEIEFLSKPYEQDSIPEQLKDIPEQLKKLSRWAIKYVKLSNKKTKEENFEEVFRYTIHDLFGKEGLYTNLLGIIPKKEKRIEEYSEKEKNTLMSSIKSLNNKIGWLWYEPADSKKGKKVKYDVHCSFCNEEVTVKKKEDISYFSFQNKFNSLLGGSKGEFPNSFWNNTPNMLICPRCAFFIIHHHIPFAKNKTLNGEIFINAPSFKVMWYLNKFVEEILSKNNSYDLRKILGISFIEFAQRVHITLGAWSVMNIEMIIKREIIKEDGKKEQKIDYYSLPYHISCILLQKDIANLISQTKEPVVLETVLKGDFEELLRLSHGIIKFFSNPKNEASKNKEDILKKTIISKLKNTNEQNLKELSEILPKLYVKINSIIKSEVRS